MIVDRRVFFMSDFCTPIQKAQNQSRSSLVKYLRAFWKLDEILTDDLV
jgi:hypothetical protein